MSLNRGAATVVGCFAACVVLLCFPKRTARNKPQEDAPVAERDINLPTIRPAPLESFPPLPSHGSPAVSPTTRGIDDPEINSNQDVTITLTTPDTADGSEVAKARLVRSRTIDEHGDVRQGLVVPPRIMKRHFEYEQIKLRKGPLKPGEKRLKGTALSPLPHSKKLEGMKGSEEPLEELYLGPPATHWLDEDDSNDGKPSERMKETPCSLLGLKKSRAQRLGQRESEVERRRRVCIAQ